MKTIRPLFVIILVALAACDSTGASGSDGSVRSLDEIRHSGELIVLTRNAPTTWYLGPDGKPAGPEHDMIEAFAASIGVRAVFREKPSVAAILEALAEGQGDLAAAGLTATERRRERFLFGPVYQEVTQQLVCRRDNVQPESVADLAGLDIEVIADSSYSERLAALKGQGHPDLAWREDPTTNTENLLEKVWTRDIDCTVADSTIVDINRRYYPELIAPLNLTREQSLAWAMPKSSEALAKAVDEWMRSYRDSGRLAAVNDRYYGFFEVFDYVDTSTYIQRIDERFPNFRDQFAAAARRHDLPDLVLAAQGYQESHWNARARSPTGVRGIMMLTLATAKAMGVSDRLDPAQSIEGGAKYLAKMKDSFVDEVTEPDRTWLALAAYNIGRAHMHDAQTLARRLDLSPYTWPDIKQVLPLLAEKRYYKDLKYGYARGTGPVRYVQRIREYQHVLANEVP